MFSSLYPKAITEKMRGLTGENRAAALETIRRRRVVDSSLASDLSWSSVWGTGEPEDFALCLELLDCLDPQTQRKIVANAAKTLICNRRVASCQRLRKIVKGLLSSGPENTQALLKEHGIQGLLK